MIGKGFYPKWADEFPGAVTVCDRAGIVVYMNRESERQFSKYEGKKLLGKSLIECHPEPARTQLLQMLEKPTENKYISEKNGRKKLVVQSPWIENGEFKGVVEISVYLP
ncbi:MAG TPA: PAS domain S-box protein [Mariniphaga anaerophila]|uniref:PAS domain S-box protein n=1 Tax=Mariniphaga anaerophila TaxID=1484053 RepID=A0A831LPX3_9BACT|nr:PAS domain S-box protein [Mariniphaga anaerophila]